jgi:hypothetical protein
MLEAGHEFEFIFMIRVLYYYRLSSVLLLFIKTGITTNIEFFAWGITVKRLFP